MRSIVSAYRDTGSIIESIKANQAIDPSSLHSRTLEDSIESALLQIEREFDQHVADYGEQFEEGDAEAVIEIQRATIDLQSGVLRVVGDALRADGGDANGLAELIEVAHQCGNRVMNALRQLRKRLEQADAEGSERDGRASITDRPILQSSQERTTAKPPVQRRTWARDNSTSGDDDSGGGARQERPRYRRHRHESFLVRLKHGHHRQRSTTHGATQILDATVPSDTKISRLEIDGTNPVSSESTSTFPTQDWTLQPRHRASTKGTLSVSPRTNSAFFASPTFNLHTAERKNSVGIPHPSPENDYLGFCEGAWRLWTGDRKAMKRSREMGTGHLHSTVYYLTCSNSKCAFESHLNLDRIWTQVWKRPEQGIKFRWPFLAKSHVQQKGRIRDEMFAFQCMFCVFLDLPGGEEERALYYGFEAYLEHIAQEHRGKSIGDIVLYKLGCVNDRICEDDEEFDINLFPIGAIEDDATSSARIGERRSGEVQVETVGGCRPSDAKSEDEPWNAGLSDFHMGDMELIDRRFTRDRSSLASQ